VVGLLVLGLSSKLLHMICILKVVRLIRCFVHRIGLCSIWRIVFFVVVLFGFSFLFFLWLTLWVPCYLKLILGFTYGLNICLLFCCLRWFGVGKIRLFVRTRKNAHGSYIASVPLEQLVKLSGYPKTHWSFKDGWLILEAF